MSFENFTATHAFDYVVLRVIAGLTSSEDLCTAKAAVTQLWRL